MLFQSCLRLETILSKNFLTKLLIFSIDTFISSAPFFNFFICLILIFYAFCSFQANFGLYQLLMSANREVLLTSFDRESRIWTNFPTLGFNLSLLGYTLTLQQFIIHNDETEQLSIENVLKL